MLHFHVFHRVSGTEMKIKFKWTSRNHLMSISGTGAGITGMDQPQDRGTRCFEFTFAVCDKVCPLRGWLAWAPLPKPLMYSSRTMPNSSLISVGCHPSPLQRENYIFFIIIADLNHLLVMFINPCWLKAWNDYRCHWQICGGRLYYQLVWYLANGGARQS